MSVTGQVLAVYGQTYYEAITQLVGYISKELAGKCTHGKIPLMTKSKTSINVKKILLKNHQRLETEWNSYLLYVVWFYYDV